MASRALGIQAVLRNQRIVHATPSEMRSWTSSSRPMGALENAAIPRNVNGCQANGSRESVPDTSRILDASGLDSRSAIGLFRRLWGLSLLPLGRRLDEDEIHRVANLHDVVDQHFNEVDSRGGELDVAEQ